MFGNWFLRAIGGSSVTARTRALVTEGDSITSGSLATTLTTYATNYPLVALPAVIAHNPGVAGDTLALVDVRAAADDAYLQPGLSNVFSILVGANDLNTSMTAATFIANLATYCDARRAAGWYMVVITVLPRSSGPLNGKRGTVNAAIRSWPGVHCDAVVDLDSTIMGIDTTTANALYYPDGLHPSGPAATSTTGQGVILAAYAQVVDAIRNGKVLPPVFSEPTETANNDLSITILCATSGASIYYTVDGSTPSAASTLYTGAISVGATETIKAIGIKTGMTDSNVFSQTYTLQCATPTFSPVGGSYVGSQDITISTATTGASMYYTTDGSTPTTGSTAYSAPITVASSQTVKVLAVKSGYTDSAIGTAVYVVDAYDSDATAWQTAVTSNGGTVSAGTMQAVSDFCVAAKNHSYWSKIDRINLFAGDQAAAALVPLKAGLGAALDVATNSPTYAESTGYTFNGSNNYLSTGLLASALTSSDTHLSVYIRAETSAQGLIGAYTGSDFYLFRNGGSIFNNMYAVTGRANGTISTPGKFVLGTRNNTSTNEIYSNGSLSASGGAVSGTLSAVNKAIYVGALNNNGSAANHSNCVLGAYSIGSGMTSTDDTNFNTDMVAFQTALSRNV